MRKIKLGDLCVVSDGQLREAADTIIDYIDISSVDNISKRVTGFKTMTFGEAPSRARKRVKKGSILVSTVRPNLNAVAILEEETPNVSVASTGFCILDCKENVDERFVFDFCKSQSFIDEMVAQATGASYPAVSDKIVRSALVPAYTYEEQCEISEVLDNVFDIIEKRKEELQNFDDLIKARFAELFGSIYNNIFGFDVMTLQDVCEQIKDGTHQTPMYTDDTINGYKFLSSKDVTTGKIDWNHLKYIPGELHTELYKKISPKKGDILLAKNGTTGIAAIVDRDEVFDIYVSLALLRPLQLVTSEYLCAAVNSAETKQQFDSSLKGIGVPNLHLGEIKKTKIIVPPIELQNQFTHFTNCVNKSKLLEARQAGFIAKTGRQISFCR